MFADFSFLIWNLNLLTLNIVKLKFPRGVFFKFNQALLHGRCSDVWK